MVTTSIAQAAILSEADRQQLAQLPQLIQKYFDATAVLCNSMEALSDEEFVEQYRCLMEMRKSIPELVSRLLWPKDQEVNLAYLEGRLEVIALDNALRR